MQKVQIYLMISGDYCAFHEIDFSVVYDITNGKQLSDYSLEELEDWEGEYSDVQEVEAYLIDGEYYYNI